MEDDLKKIYLIINDYKDKIVSIEEKMKRSITAIGNSWNDSNYRKLTENCTRITILIKIHLLELEKIKDRIKMELRRIG